MIKTRLKLVIYLMSFFLVACETGAKSEAGVSGAYIKALAPGQATGAVYLLLNNPTKNDLVLNYVSTPVAEAVEVHRIFYEDGNMKMRAVNHLRIPRESKLVFESGGYHLMLMGIHESLKKGEFFTVTLEFEGGLKLSAEVKVK